MVYVFLAATITSTWCTALPLRCGCFRCAGIGFKAVGIVSEATYIDSGGFNFCFDTRPSTYPDNPRLRWLGLVVPSWEDNLSSKMEEWLTNGLAGKRYIPAVACCSSTSRLLYMV